MRITLTFFLLFLSTLNSSAQPLFTVNPDTSYGFGNLSTSFLQIESYIVNTSTDTLLINWQRDDVDLPSNWFTSICEPTISFPPSVISGSFMILPNDSAKILCQYYINSTYAQDTGITDITYWTGNDTLSVRYIGIVSSTSVIYESFNEISKIYPVPAKDILQIEFKNEVPHKITLINLSANKIQSFYPTTLKWQINLSKYASGIYILKAMDESGKIIGTTKLILK